MWKGIVGLQFDAAGFAEYASHLTLGAWRPKFVVLHNTGSPRLSEWHSVSGAERMQNLQHYYRDQQKWSAGPHLFIADDAIWTFTPLTVQGVHSPSWNAVSWGVEMVGDYDAEPFGVNVASNTAAALAALHKLGGLDPSTLKFHREDPKTTHRNCPGHNVVKAQIINAVRAEMH